ncbi:REDY-like protein HapK [Sphingobium sp. CR2-8]|uniref:REDY-like protein HapK n=1 Tax=Sphingobium sp. CR2-8 TaxID=1306534 RepID=UPI002DBE1D43|nr:REDY-like protein HapK [Sphingobium sp. CR2-8]MEC3911435.1 REDY-like protein HapK [Sphingobium sp. CR2-8]
MRLIALFNLKPGISVESYEQWARTVDLPTVNGLSSIERFDVFRATGQLGSDAPAPYQYVEIIDVADMDQFGQDVATDAMQAVAAAFQDMADVTFLTTEQIKP